MPAHRVFASGANEDLPRFLVQFLLPGDGLAFLAAGHTEILIERYGSRSRPAQLLYATVGYAGLPKERESGAGFFVRADLPNRSTGPKTLLLPGGDIRRYFYRWRASQSADSVRPPPDFGLAPLADLRFRGRRKKRWLADVLRHAGEKADYVEAFE